MATDAQRELVRLKDPVAYAGTQQTDPTPGARPPTTLDDALDLAALQLSRRTYGNMFDLAVALSAICTIRRQSPNIGGGMITMIGEGEGNRRSKSQQNMPAGYPAHWYTCPAGEELIGLTSSLTPPSFG